MVWIIAATTAARACLGLGLKPGAVETAPCPTMRHSQGHPEECCLPEPSGARRNSARVGVQGQEKIVRRYEAFHTAHAQDFHNVVLHRIRADFFEKFKKSRRAVPHASRCKCTRLKSAVEFFDDWPARACQGLVGDPGVARDPGRGISKMPRSAEATTRRPGSTRTALASMRRPSLVKSR